MLLFVFPNLEKFQKLFDVPISTTLTQFTVSIKIFDLNFKQANTNDYIKHCLNSATWSKFLFDVQIPNGLKMN